MATSDRDISPVTGRRAAAPVSLVHITTSPMTLHFLRGQVQYMLSQGFSVHAIASGGADLERFGAEEGIPVEAVEMPRRISPFRDIVAVAELYRIFRRISPAIVQGHTPKGALLGMIAAWLARVPVRIYTVHGLLLETATGPARRILRVTEMVSCRLATRVLCVSESVRGALVRQGLCPEGKVEVIGGGSINGVDGLQRFHPGRIAPAECDEARMRYGIPSNARVIGYIGRLVRDKGIDVLAEAWKTIRVRFPDVHLLLVGPLESRDPLSRETVRSLQSDSRIHLAGMEWNTPPLYAMVDLVVLPTFREGFPVVPLEAAAMSRPIVATRVTGCVDAVVDGVTGILVAPGDPNALAAAVGKYLEDPPLARRHGEQARARVLDQFQPRRIWKGVRDFYSRELQRQGVPHSAAPPVPSAAVRSADLANAVSASENSNAFVI